MIICCMYTHVKLGLSGMGISGIGPFRNWAFLTLIHLLYIVLIIFFRQNIFASYRTRIYKFTLGCKFVQLQQLHMYIVKI